MFIENVITLPVRGTLLDARTHDPRAVETDEQYLNNSVRRILFIVQFATMPPFSNHRMEEIMEQVRHEDHEYTVIFCVLRIHSC